MNTNEINTKIGYKLKERRLEVGLTIMKANDITGIKA